MKFSHELRGEILFLRVSATVHGMKVAAQYAMSLFEVRSFPMFQRFVRYRYRYLRAYVRKEIERIRNEHERKNRSDAGIRGWEGD